MPTRPVHVVDPSAQHAAPAEAVPPAVGDRVVVLKSCEALTDHLAAWDTLAAEALEPNPCYESWMLLPALRAFGRGVDFRFVLVYQDDYSQPRPRTLLTGFFPLALRRRYKGLPVRTLSLWRHVHCVLATPLVRAQSARACLNAFFDWLAADGANARFVELSYITGDGPFHQHLVDVCNARGRLTYLDESFSRALCRPARDADSYLRTASSTKNRKELRRQQRRLSELGQLRNRILQPGDNVEEWLQAFFSLEASGWKGRVGTALHTHFTEKRFFMELARAAHKRQRLMMLGLFLDEEPVALKLNLLAAPGSFAFKIAFDERYARFSPGVQLELDNIRLLHALPALQWMDSWAVANHSMIDRLWSERRTIQTMVVSTGRTGGDLLVSALPLLRWLHRKFVRRPDRPVV